MPGEDGVDATIQQPHVSRPERMGWSLCIKGVSVGFLFYKLEPMEFGVEAWNSGFAAQGREKDALTSLMTRDS